MIDQQNADLQRKRLAAMIKDGDYGYTRPRRGEVREAVILSIGEHDVVVDLRGKRDGIVLPTDLELLDDEYRASLEVGDHVPVVILKAWGRRDRLIVVSLDKGQEHKDWLRAQDLLDSGKTFEAVVTEFNSGGVIVAYGSLRGFVPNSHLTSVPRGRRKTPAGSQGQTGGTDLIAGGTRGEPAEAAVGVLGARREPPQATATAGGFDRGGGADRHRVQPG